MSDDNDGFGPDDPEQPDYAAMDDYFNTAGAPTELAFDMPAIELEPPKVEPEIDEWGLSDDELKENNILTLGKLSIDRIDEIKAMIDDPFACANLTDEELLEIAEKAAAINRIAQIEEEEDEFAASTKEESLVSLKSRLRKAERRKKTKDDQDKNGGFAGEPWTLDLMLNNKHYGEVADVIPDLVQGFMPLGKVAVLAAKGGTGKSMLALQLCMAISGGSGAGDFLGLSTVSQGRTMFLSREDDKTDVQDRIFSILKTARESSDNKDAIDVSRIKNNMAILDLTAEQMRMTMINASTKKVVVNDAVVTTVIGSAALLGDVKLIVVDTYSQFNSGEENSNTDAAMFISACKEIASETGATVLVLAHMRKGGGKGVDDVAGGGRLVDSARWAATLSYSIDEKLKDEGEISEDEYYNSIVLSVVKQNGKNPFRHPLYIDRNENGTLVLGDKPASNKQKGLDKARVTKGASEDVNYSRVLPMILDEIGANGGIKKTSLIKNYTGSEKFGTGEKKIGMYVQKALSQGLVAEKKSTDGRGYGLYLTEKGEIEAEF